MSPKIITSKMFVFFSFLAELSFSLSIHIVGCPILFYFYFFSNDVCLLSFSNHQPVSFLPSHIFPPVMNSSFSSDSSSSLPSPAGYLPISFLSFDPPPHAFSMHAENFSFTHNPYSIHTHAGFLLFTYSTALIIYHLKKITMVAFSFLSLWVIVLKFLPVSGFHSQCMQSEYLTKM